MFVVDTNVLIYAVNADSPEHKRCRSLLEGWRAGRVPWYTTWPLLYEFIRVVTHPRVLPRPLSAAAAFDFMSAILASPSHNVLVETPRHFDLARESLGTVPGLAGNLLHDFHTAVLMREHGLSRVYTRDADFRRFPFLEVIDPLA